MSPAGLVGLSILGGALALLTALAWAGRRLERRALGRFKRKETER